MIIFEQKIIFFQKLKLFENWCPLILVPKHFWEPTVLYFSWGPTGNYGPFCHFKVGAKFAPRYYQGNGVRMALPTVLGFLIWPPFFALYLIPQINWYYRQPGWNLRQLTLCREEELHLFSKLLWTFLSYFLILPLKHFFQTLAWLQTW